MPTSTVRMPSRVAMIGPTVLPHGTVLRDTNTWDGTPAARHARAHAAAEGLAIEYRAGAVEDEAGLRFWLFRAGDGADPATGPQAWFLHGLFG